MYDYVDSEHEISKKKISSKKRGQKQTESIRTKSFANPVIQRNIGFEYETNVYTYVARHILTDTEVNTAQIPAHAQPHHKGDVLVQNMQGLHAKADESTGGIGSDLEMETDAFPETAGGRNQLHQALKNLERFCTFVSTRSPQIRCTKLAAAFGGGVTNNLSYISKKNKITGNPQATAGVRQDRLESLMERAVGLPNAGPHAQANPNMDRITLGVQADIRIVGNAPGQVRQGFNNYQVAIAPVIPPPLSDGLVGLCSLLLTYIVRGNVGQMYAKQIAPIMARTEFGTLFANLSLAEQGFYSNMNGNEFVNLFTYILAQAGAGVVAAPLFVIDPATVIGFGFNFPGSLQRDQWLRGITQRNDLLTSNTFPSVPARPHLFGLGEFGNMQDADPTGGGVNRPIFELRRMRKDVSPHEFTEIAMGVFDYIVDLNTGMGNNATYAPVLRAAKQPKYFQKFRFYFSR